MNAPGAWSATFLRWPALVGLSLAIALVLEMAHVPAAFLLGPMLAAIGLAANDHPLTVDLRITQAAQAVIGCMVARSIPLSILPEIARDWPIFLAGVVSVIAASVLLGGLLARFHVLPGTTAIWGSVPGAASAMTIMSESFGADMRMVALMQYLRMVCVAFSASLVARIWVGPVKASAAVPGWFAPVDGLALAETAALILVCLVVGRRIRLPAAIFLLPLLAGLVAQNSGLMHIELPPALLAASYVIVGWSIGLRFNRPILIYALRALPRILGSILVLILLCGLFALALVEFAGIDPLTAYLATSPGGADAIAIIAASSKVDLSFVMAMQLARFLLILMFGPLLARLVVKWSGLDDRPLDERPRDNR